MTTIGRARQYSHTYNVSFTHYSLGSQLGLSTLSTQGQYIIVRVTPYFTPGLQSAFWPDRVAAVVQQMLFKRFILGNSK